MGSGGKAERQVSREAIGVAEGLGACQELAKGFHVRYPQSLHSAKLVLGWVVS